MSAQEAADAAALAAASRFHSDVGGSKYICDTGLTPCVASWQCPATLTTATTAANAVESACLYARQNGFWPWKADGTRTNQNVLIDSHDDSVDPPTAPGLKTAAYWITVRVTQQVPQLFSAVMGNNTGMIAARASAAVTASTDCIYVMDPSGDNTYYQNGSTTLTSGCGIYVNSTSPTAMSNSGNSTVTAPEFDIVGNYDWHGSITPTPNTGAAPALDPLRAVAPPSPCSSSGGCADALCPNGGSTYTVNTAGTQDVPPGTYCNGIFIKKGTAHFTGGTYILVGGGIGTQDTNSIVTGSGFFYNTYDSHHAYTPVSFAANSSVQLSAPTTGTYASMLFMQDRFCCSGTIPQESFQGGPDAKFEGTLYFPKSQIQFAGNPSMVTAHYTIIVAWQFNLLGTSNVNNDYSGLPGGTPIKQVGLIE
jgi:hypothetical protein